jgi:hypothetical protein
MVAAHFREIGLKPIGDADADGNPTYFQNVPFLTPALDPERTSFEVTGGPKPISVRPGEGFSATGFGDLEADAPLVFAIVPAGRGKAAGLDVSGKVVIVVSFGADGAVVPAQGGTIADLRKAGAAAVVRVDDVVAAQGLAPGGAVRKDLFKPNPARGPNVYVSQAVAGAIAETTGRTLAAMLEAVKASGDARTVPTRLSAKIRVGSKVVDVRVPNVVGYLEGSDPKLKSELVIVGSHLDHLGRSRTGEIYNGADDDGSGSTGVLAVSRAFTRNARAPKRSVMFLAFCGEEMGLLGSDWYVRNPIVPLDAVVAELQMDMIGRREEAHEGENPGNETADENANTLHLIGSKKIAPGLHDLIVKINAEHCGFSFEYDQEGVYYRSDHFNFAKKGIPIAFFFTGFHRDYHQTGDDVSKIDFDKLARVAQLVYLTAWELAERRERLPADKSKAPQDGR